MAPYNNTHGNHYDPVDSQYSQQHQQGYSYPAQRSNSAAQYSESTTSANYQPSYPTGHSSTGSYYSWSHANQQPQHNTEDRAAEALSNLSAQDQGTTTSDSRGAHGQYGTYGGSYASSLSATQPVATGRDKTAISNSPVYQASQPSQGRAPGYASAQSYSNTTPAYPYPSYSSASHNQSGLAPQMSSRPSQSPATTYQYPSSTSKSQTAPQVPRPDSPYQAQQQQQQQQQQHSAQSKGRKDKSTLAQTSTISGAQNNAHDHRSANVGQPRAPSLTPSAVQQRAGSSGSLYNHQTQQGASEHPAPITVDPSQVYDAWPEQQRRIREAEARRKAEEAAKAKAQKEEDERKAAAATIAEARRKEEQKREEAKRKEEERRAEALKKAEEERRAAEEVTRREMEVARSSAAAPPSAEALAFAGASGAAPGSDLEAEMLAMFKKMREFNEKNPSMLARLWDQERKAHIAKTQSAAPPPTQPTTTHAPRVLPPVPHTNPGPPRAAQPVDSQIRPTSTVAMNAAGKSPARPVFAPPTTSSAQAVSNVPLVSDKPGSNTIWPPGKKLHLADAAVKWLNTRPENAGNQVTSNTVVTLLDSNPSYLNLCETLETMGLKVERAAFARALLSAVPDVNKPQSGTSPRINPSQSQPSLANIPSTIPSGSSDGSTPITPLGGGPKTKMLGKRGNPRGRPSKDAVSSPKTRGRPKKGAIEATNSQANVKGKQPQFGSTSTIDLTGTATTGTSTTREGPSPVEIYQTARARDQPEIVAYESGYNPPPDDDYRGRAPQATMVATQPTQSANPSYVSPYFQQAIRAQSHRGLSISSPAPAPTLPKQTSQSNTRLSISSPVSRYPLPNQPSRPPANKEEAARKRTFAELVDLTAINDGSDEELEPQAKHQKLGYPPSGTTMASGLKTISGYLIPSQPQVALNQYMYNGNISGTIPQPPTGGDLAAHSQSQTQQPTQEVAITSLESELKDQVLVQGIHRENVARKSRYDPRTICRDVLLATGRHPEMRALNQHLFGMHEFLKKHSVNVDGDKLDLGTIRWDLIDPGEPISAVVNPASEAGTDADDEDEQAETKQTDKPARSTTVQAHRRKPFMKKNRGLAVRKSMPAKLSESRVEVGGESSDQGSQAEAVSSAPAALSAESASNTPQFTTSAFTPVNRPTRMSGTPSSAPVGYAEFSKLNTKLDEFGNPIKKKGRPVGWRKSLHSKAALAAAASGQSPASTSSAVKSTAAPKRVAPPASNDQMPRRRGRPPKHLSQQPREVEAEFNVYKCEWQDCKAELHNVDTLRKHLIKLHGKKTADNDFECFWTECFKDRSGEEDEPFVFDTMEEWLAHMEASHILPLARQLGDGPRHGLSEPHDSEVSEAYLSDATTGRIVTPKIPSSSVAPEEDSETWKIQRERELAAKRLTVLRETGLKNEALLQQLEQKKRLVGPGLDRAGCTLMNDQRRRGFYDDEDFEEVIDPDEFEES